MGDVGLSLNMIDQHLQRKNGAALVADAFDLVGPFFAEMMKARLQAELETVHDMVNWQQIEGEIMVYYFLNKTFPNFQKNEALRRYLTFSHDDQTYNQAQAIYPFMTEFFQRKTVMTMIGTQDLDYKKGKTIKELEHESIEQTRQDLDEYE